jgi:SsrA-binding protein
MTIIVENKKALADYKIMEKWQAGIKLTGPEVKSVKLGKIDLKGSYVTTFINAKTKNLEIWLVNLTIAKYPKSGYAQDHYLPQKKRKLLLNKKEINVIIGKIKQRGLTIIPLSMYTSQRLIKVEIALVVGKKKFDKREVLKKREFDRQIRQKMKYNK